MFATLGYYICVPFAALVKLFYNLTGSLRRRHYPLYPCHQAYHAALPDQVEEEHDPHEPHVR